MTSTVAAQPQHFDPAASPKESASASASPTNRSAHSQHSQYSDSGSYGGGWYSYDGGVTGHSMPSLLSSTERTQEFSPNQNQRQIDKSRRHTENGRTIVTTPWYPNGTLKDNISLGGEVNQLGKLLKLTPGEVSIRKGCRSTLQELIREVWPGVTVKVYGSFSYGLSLPTSPLDLVCEGCADVDKNIDAFVDKVHSIGFRVDGKYGSSSEGFVLIKAGDLTANLALCAGKSIARKSVTTMRSLIEKYPFASPAFGVIRLLLQQARCNDALTGGLSSYATLIMIFHTCITAAPKDSGQLLVAFFRQFGGTTEAVACATEARSTREAKKNELFVEDPLNPDNNLAAGCKRLPQIRSVFNTASMTLEKWLSPKWTGYRGRTPLSSILGYGDLWDRASSHEPFMQENDAEAKAQRASTADTLPSAGSTLSKEQPAEL
eukprot:TRINITY_DN3932_c0_g1_i2.p1 TRINITY_DN3932_c0_g1~~TRINITY_DN3932_c0_g1_i2.p1  ORF type:complete len:447 (+),score=171.18 TRINITY_DN3932_c0_g1_i2:44-1342(+)